MAKLISSTYADALFDIAIEKKTTSDWQKEIETVKSILEENDGFGKLMQHPQIAKEERLNLAMEAFDGNVDPEIVGLIRIVIEKGRFGEIDSIFDAFIARVKEYEGIGIAYVSTAVELTDVQKNAVMAKLLETTDYKSMEMHFNVDEALIGGMVIRIGDRVVDSSIKTRLEELTRQLMKAQI